VIVETPWEPEDSRRDVEETLQRLSVIATLNLIITMRGQQRPRGTLWAKPLLPTLTPYDLASARQTFAAIAADFEDDPDLDELLKGVDCLPLAVTLLATVAEGEPSLDGILARWRVEKTKFVKDGSGNTRHGSLEASIEMSIQCARMKSEPSALQLLSLLALLPNGVSVADTQTHALGIQPSALGAVATLRKVALVYDDPANSRVRILSPIQIYVSSQYPPTPMLLESLQAHYAAISQLGKKVGQRDGTEALPKLRSEAENIQAIVEHALTEDAEGNPLSWTTIKWALEAANNLTDFLWYSGLGSTRSLGIAANVARDLQQPSGEADCLSSIGFVASGRAEYALAEDSYLAALERYRAQQSVAGEAECLRGLGFVAHHVADFEKAIPYFLDGLALFEKLEFKWGQGECLKGLAMISSASSKMDDASEKYARALQLFKDVGNATGEADCMRGEGYVALRNGGMNNLEAAVQSFAKGLELFKKVGKLTGEGDCLQGMGQVEFSRGNFQTSGAHFQDAYDMFSKVGHPWKKALCLKSLGDVSIKLNQDGEAKVIYEDALDLFIEVGNKTGEAECLSALARLNGQLAL
jgi:tetratricopeptide (TPR) repeat protein